MSLATMLAADVAVLFDAAAETVTYRPAAGGSFAIPAVVFRGEPNRRDETQRAKWRQASILVRNSAVTSLGVAAPSEHGDTVDVVLREGTAAVTARVVSVEGGNAGAWLLRVSA